MASDSKINGISDLRREVNNLITIGKSSTEIFDILKNNRSDSFCSNDSAFMNTIKSLCEEYPNYDWIQKIMRSKIIMDIETEKYYLFDKQLKEQKPTSWSGIKNCFHPKFDLKGKIYNCVFEYDPMNKSILERSGKGYYIFNTYIPPKWYEDVIYTGKRLEPVQQIPPLYKKYLMHLVNGHEGSYQYILDWLSHAIKDRNRCALVTIGKQGIGKGILGGIMRELVGDTNYFEGEDKMFKERFNPQLSDKRIVYCDEFEIKSQRDENSLKKMANDTIEVEKKGVDSVEARNFASLYMSSNNLDSLRLPADDRRFSIVELTKEKIILTWTESEIKKLFEPENIDEFARFLYFRNYDRHRMMLPFKTKYSEEIRSASLFDWQDWFLDEYCVDNAGKSRKQREVSDDIGEQFGFNRSPSHRKLQSLEELYPHKFHVVRKRDSSNKNKRVWFIEFKTIEEQKKGS